MKLKLKQLQAQTCRGADGDMRSLYHACALSHACAALSPNPRSVMRISELAALVPFYTFAEVEAVVVDAVKHDYLQVGGQPRVCAQGVKVLRVCVFRWRVARMLVLAEFTVSRLWPPLSLDHALAWQMRVDHRNGTLHLTHSFSALAPHYDPCINPPSRNPTPRCAWTTATARCTSAASRWRATR